MHNQTSMKNLLIIISILLVACDGNQTTSKMEENSIPTFSGKNGEVVLMTLDPGHFHAALVQKDMYEQISPKAYVYAPKGDDVLLHLDKINQYNSRNESPTKWEEVVYTGDDYLEKMLQEKPGNVMMVAGNNGRKTEYIQQAVANNIHVYADKPMVIEPDEYELLKETIESARKQGILVYDIMTERFEITTILQKELSEFETVFGQLEKGTPENPAISKESVHHFFKYVSGNPLKRPAWFFDVTQQGEGIADVSTHLVDLIMWECFPEQGIMPEEVEVISGKRWQTELIPSQFNKVTGTSEYPAYLQKHVVSDSVLQVYSNGEIIFTVKGVHGKASVIWNYEAPEGAKDTHFSMMRGSKDKSAIEKGLKEALKTLSNKYPDLNMQPNDAGWEIIIPDKYKVGHEAHFAQVTEKYLSYLKAGKIPDWEYQNILTKYLITTEAYKLSHQQIN